MEKRTIDKRGRGKKEERWLDDSQRFRCASHPKAATVVVRSRWHLLPTPLRNNLHLAINDCPVMDTIHGTTHPAYRKLGLCGICVCGSDAEGDPYSTHTHGVIRLMTVGRSIFIPSASTSHSAQAPSLELRCSLETRHLYILSYLFFAMVNVFLLTRVFAICAFLVAGA